MSRSVSVLLVLVVASLLGWSALKRLNSATPSQTSSGAPPA